MAARGACSVDRSRHPDSCIATHAVVGGRDVGWRRSRSVQPKGFEALRRRDGALDLRNAPYISVLFAEFDAFMQNMSLNCEDNYAASKTHPSDRRSASAQIAAASYDQWARMTRS